MSQQLAPDEGMGLLLRRMAADSGETNLAAAAARDEPVDQAPEPAGGGGLLEAFASLGIQLGSVAEQMRKSREAGKIPWQYCHPIPLNPIVVSAAGVALNDERWEPRASWYWHITRVSVQSLATGGATLVVCAQDSLNAGGAYNLQSFPPVGTTATAGAFLGAWEPKGKFLAAGNRLIFQGTGGGFVVNGEGIEIREDWLATYLM